jgi:hypothetical protein
MRNVPPDSTELEPDEDGLFEFDFPQAASMVMAARATEASATGRFSWNIIAAP